MALPQEWKCLCKNNIYEWNVIGYAMEECGKWRQGRTSRLRRHSSTTHNGNLFPQEDKICRDRTRDVKGVSKWETSLYSLGVTRKQFTWKWDSAGEEGKRGVLSRDKDEQKCASLSGTSCMRCFHQKNLRDCKCMYRPLCKQKVCILKCTINVFSYNIVYSSFS